MGTEAIRRQKRRYVGQLLREAGDLLAQAGAKTIAAGKALEQLEAAIALLERSGAFASPTSVEPIPSAGYRGKIKRDGLPADVVAAIRREQQHLVKLQKRVADIAITRSESLAKTREKASKGR